MENQTTLYYTNPELRDEWDGNIEDMKKPIPVARKVNWKCKTKIECHRWISNINNRKKKDRPRGCPYCVNKKICSKEGCWCNSLWALKPLLRDEWNGNIDDMKTYSISSGKEVSWKCLKGISCHIWYESVKSRVSRGECPYCTNCKICSKEGCWCNSLWALKPELREYWNDNSKDMKKTSIGCEDIVNWKCKTGNICHNFKSPANNYCCPYCRYREPIICEIDHCNSLWALFPDLRIEWCGNIEEMKKYFPNSNEDKDWKCNKTNCNRIWNTTIINRTKFNINCFVCTGKKICSNDYTNSLWALYPELRDEWFGDIDEMKCYLPFSNKEVKWKCNTGKDCHMYSSPISRRTGINKSGCSYCIGRYVCSKEGCWCNSLFILRPDLHKEWNGNIDDMKKYPIASHSYVEWKCNKGHIWSTRINQRTSNKCGCPICDNKTEQKIFDILIKFLPTIKRQFKVEWCKNKTYLPFDFVLENDKIIIELDGPQHFHQISNWESPEKTQINDKYKMKCANDNGYSIIRLLQEDVFYDTYIWIEELKTNIEKIKTNNIVQNIYMCKNNEYDIFQSLEVLVNLDISLESSLE